MIERWTGVPEGASSNPAESTVFQLTSAVLEKYEIFSSCFSQDDFEILKP